MHRHYNKFLIVSTIFITIFCVYYYFYNDLVSEANESSIVSSLGEDSGDQNPITEDTSFLMKLNSLKKIKIDKSLFESRSFKILVDNNIKLEPVPYGRINPFSPSEKLVNYSKPVINVKTGKALSITSTSATLTGSMEGVSSNNIYIEYGSTEKFGKTTSKLTPSLVGSFSANVTGLNSKTTYYFRAVANVNNSSLFGEVMTFTTN